jgi:hypothetical protein
MVDVDYKADQVFEVDPSMTNAEVRAPHRSPRVRDYNASTRNESYCTLLS